MNNVVVTGGAGFIGFNFVKLALKETDWNIFVVDSMTYAANKDAVHFFAKEDRVHFTKKNIKKLNQKFINKHSIDTIINFAAETHVDNSIWGPSIFIDTNVMGTQNLLELARANELRYHQISTDEVYGDLPLDKPEMKFTVDWPLNPSSPYSASKAAADLLVQAYVRTYKLKATISRCSNNYGPHQNAEKLIPKTILNMKKGDVIGIYGDGKNVRDWIYVDDHNKAVIAILNSADNGIYNVGSNNEINNIDIIKTIANSLDLDFDEYHEFIEDRKGHDRRYAIDPASMESLDWKSEISFEEGIKTTVKFYENS